ncbi:hypothetical protein [Terribacillus saccharophilus]|uniref:hypothetical protein n=1 Tax=Terribacillus saccharophilus TaxID=361277 RepID=UPI002989C5A8|nr:hypothetical protein [Terribacillus saccharophilus]MCM3227715.1 hypothetical protein [Terribacillus saccharophilus]
MSLNTLDTKSIETESIRRLFFVIILWTSLVMGVYSMVTLHLEGLSQTFIIATVVILALYFLFSLNGMYKLMEQIEAPFEERIAFYLVGRTFYTASPKNIFDYFKQFPDNKPYVSVSIAGLILLYSFTDFQNAFFKTVSETPVIDFLYAPFLYIYLIVYVFGSYFANNAKNFYFRTAIKALFIFYSPMFFFLFIIGLLSPIIVLIRSILLIQPNSLADLSSLISEPAQLIAWILYPIVIFFVSHSHFIRKVNLVNEIRKKRTER